MKGGTITGNARKARKAALAAAVLLLCLPIGLAQRPRAQQQAQAPRYSAPRAQPSRPQPARGQQGRPQGYGQAQPQYRPTPQPQYRPTPQPQQFPQNRTAQPQNGNFRQAPVTPPASTRPVYPGSTNPRVNPPGSAYQGQGYTRPASPGGVAQPAYAPPGHLGSWLNEHRGVTSATTGAHAAQRSQL
jgi:hypothetical protein